MCVYMILKAPKTPCQTALEGEKNEPNDAERERERQVNRTAKMKEKVAESKREGRRREEGKKRQNSRLVESIQRGEAEHNSFSPR